MLKYAELTNAERARAWAVALAADPEGGQMPFGFREWAQAHPVGRPAKADGRPTLEETPYTIANLLARQARRATSRLEARPSSGVEATETP
jgi:hypothetical protein